MTERVLLVSDGWFHPPLLARRVLHHLFIRAGSYRVTLVHSLDDFPENSSSLSAVVLYFHHWAVSDAALKKLQGFVFKGGGLMAVHSATASFKEQPEYAQLVGGSFSGHGPVSEFECIPEPGGGVFAGLSSFSVRDELYLHEFEPGIQVHYTSLYDGEKVPVVWTRSYGQGRVCAAVPGHTLSALHNPVYQQVLLSGLAWVGGL
jgi:uncharacterized protein